jgi:Rieske Fe-S protein
VTWNESGRSWDCPCHGPRFDVDGTVLDTPAVEDLDTPAVEDLDTPAIEDLDTVEPAGIEPCGMGSTRKTR